MNATYTNSAGATASLALLEVETALAFVREDHNWHVHSLDVIEMAREWQDEAFLIRLAAKAMILDAA